jgi:hypothetical protein
MIPANVSKPMSSQELMMWNELHTIYYYLLINKYSKLIVQQLNKTSS